MGKDMEGGIDKKKQSNLSLKVKGEDYKQMKIARGREIVVITKAERKRKMSIKKEA